MIVVHVALLAAMIPTGVVVALIFLFILFVIIFVIGLYTSRDKESLQVYHLHVCVDLGLVNFGLIFLIISDKADVSTSDKKRFVINFNVEFDVF